ncbi:MAG: hypothetical protein PUF10_02685 [Bacteroidales bacterium]|nr:hypothetical protein [Bacteroidales bacterium]
MEKLNEMLTAAKCRIVDEFINNDNLDVEFPDGVEKSENGFIKFTFEVDGIPIKWSIGDFGVCQHTPLLGDFTKEQIEGIAKRFEKLKEIKKICEVKKRLDAEYSAKLKEEIAKVKGGCNE